MSSRRKERRAVRKANRISAIDQEKPKRIARRIIAIIILIAFAVTEYFIFTISYERYSHDQSVQLSEEMSINLSLINSSLRVGDKASYLNALTTFRENLDRFSNNSFVKKHANTLVDKLQNYSNIHADDVTITTQMIELNVAMSAITNEANEAVKADIDAVKIYRLINSYNNLRNDLGSITAPDLEETKTALLSYIDEIIPYLENAAVCIGVCAEQTLSSKREEIAQVISRYEPVITDMSEHFSEKYNPNTLILELGAYSKS